MERLSSLFRDIGLGMNLSRSRSTWEYKRVEKTDKELVREDWEEVGNIVREVMKGEV